MKDNKRFVKYLDKIREGLELKVGEVSLSYSIAPERVLDLPKITDAKQVYDFIKPRWENDLSAIERFKVLFANNTNRIIAWYDLSKGTEVGTTVSVRSIIMMCTNILTCSGVFLCHNHP